MGKKDKYISELKETIIGSEDFDKWAIEKHERFDRGILVSTIGFIFASFIAFGVSGIKGHLVIYGMIFFSFSAPGLIMTLLSHFPIGVIAWRSEIKHIRIIYFISMGAALIGFLLILAELSWLIAMGLLIGCVFTVVITVCIGSADIRKLMVESKVLERDNVRLKKEADEIEVDKKNTKKRVIRRIIDNGINRKELFDAGYSIEEIKELDEIYELFKKDE